MLSEYNEGSILCCGTKSDPACEKAGLVLGHAYTVVWSSIIKMGVYDKPYRMVKLRNPWGKR